MKEHEKVCAFCGPLCAFCDLRTVPEHGEEVAGGAGDYEEVPDEVIVTNALCGKERQPTGVREPAREYQENSRHRDQHQDRFHGDDREPAHDHVKHNTDRRMACSLFDF